MPYENEYDPRTTGVLGTAVGILAPFYAWSTLAMLKDMPTKGVKIPWIGKSLWKPSRREAMMARYFQAGGILRSPTTARNLGQRLVRKGVSASVARTAVKGVAARYLIGASTGVGLAALAIADTATIVGGLTFGTYRAISQQVSKYKGLELGGHFADSQAALTSRQRAVQAITASQLQARSAIGNEAMLFHR